MLQLCQHVGSHGDVGLVFGREEEGFAEILCGFLQLVGLPIDISARVVCAWLERVAFDGGIAVHLGSCVVAQLYLGYSAQHVWLAEVGLEFDDLIKILDTKHIVIEVQGIATDSGNAIGIELCGDEANTKKPRTKTNQ